MKEKYSNDLNEIKNQLENEQNKNKQIDSKAALALGAKREKDINDTVDSMKLEMKMTQVKIDNLEQEKKIFERENNHLRRSLSESQDELKCLQNDILTQEERRNNKLELELESAVSEEKMIKLICSELEIQLAKVRDELNLAEQRNSWYEEEHNLCDAVKYQKKLEADIRRRDSDLKSKTVLLGQKEDQIALLQKTCSFMKESLGSNFNFNESELKECLAMEESQLKSQISELNRQVEDLERDRINLMKRLRENIVQISEKGMRFVGLNTEQILQLTDFARSLKEGKVNLPLNDRSLELSSKLAAMKVMRQSDMVTIERLEREIKSFKSSHNSTDVCIDSELNILREMLEDIQNQNKTLRSKIDILNKCATTEQSNEGVQHDLSPLDRHRIERVLGETLDITPRKMMNQFQCFLKEYEKVESELSIVKASMFRCSRNNQQELRNKLQQKKEVSTRGIQTINVEKNDTGVMTDSCKVIHKVNEKVNKGTGTEIPSEMTNSPKSCVEDRHNELLDKLKLAQDKSNIDQEKINKLKDALKQALLSNKSENRIKLAHASMKQLKSILDEKNKVIQKYRNKCMDRLDNQYTPEELLSFHNKENWAVGHDRTYIISKDTEELVTRLHEASNLIDQKDKTIKSLQDEVKMQAQTYNLLERRYNHADQENASLRDSNTILQKNLYQIECGSEKIEMKQTHRLNTLNEERIHLESTIEIMKLEISQKDEKTARMKSHILQLKASIKVFQDEAKSVPLLDSEIKQLKINLHVCRRTRDRWERAATTSKTKESNLIEDVEKLQLQITNLRKDVADAKDMKTKMMKRSKQIKKQLKDTQESSLKDKEVQQKLEEEKYNIEDYEKKIAVLKKDNVRLRGMVASYVIKEDKVTTPSVKQKSRATYSWSSTNSKKRSGSINLNENSVHDKMSQTDSRLYFQSENNNNIYNIGNHQPAMFKTIPMSKQGIEVKKQTQYFGRSPSEAKYQRCQYVNIDDSAISSLNLKIQHLNQIHDENIKLLDELRHELSEEQLISEKLRSELTSNRNNQNQSNTDKTMHKQIELLPVLKQEISQLKRKLSVADDDWSKLSTQYNTKLSQIKRENDMLRKELSSFSLEFFEEIEDLKFKYDQASKRLVSYGDA